MKHYILPLCLGLFGLTSASFAEEISADALSALPKVPVTVVGEVHDNPRHHLNQALAVQAIAPKALVFEMLAPDVAQPQAGLSQAELAEALGWNGSGWPDFALYAPIFEAAPAAKLYGAEVPRDVVRRAMSEGAALALGGEAYGQSADSLGLSQPLSETEQKAQEAEQLAVHCDALPPEMLAPMVEAQRLRDAYLARAALRALAETGGPVVVIAGGGHARRDRGLVQSLEAQGVKTLALGQFEESAENAPPFDFWLVTEKAEREDPCAAFLATRRDAGN